MKFLYLLLLVPMLAFGTDPHHSHEGPPGPQGEQGEDGKDGRDGKDGLDGKDGRDGLDGINGRDGVVDYSWITETRSFQSRYSKYAAASEAIQIHLPQEQESRITFGISRVHGSSGLGVGYAFKNEDGVAFTLGLGTSRGESLGKASVGFEFGGSKKEPELTADKYKAELECAYVGGELTLTNECVLEE